MSGESGKSYRDKILGVSTVGKLTESNMNPTIERNIQTEIFLASIAPEKLEQAKVALDHSHSPHNNKNLLLALAATVDLEIGEWLRAGELYGQYLD